MAAEEETPLKMFKLGTVGFGLWGFGIEYMLNVIWDGFRRNMKELED